MATPFTDIYNRALFKFADYDFLSKEIEVREETLFQYLMSAKTDFQRKCNINLEDYDPELKQFNTNLGDEEIEILALGIAYHWVSFKALNSRLLKNVLNSKDYYYYSPANMLAQIKTLRDSLRKEYNGKMNEYTYNLTELSQLRP